MAFRVNLHRAFLRIVSHNCGTTNWTRLPMNSYRNHFSSIPMTFIEGDVDGNRVEVVAKEGDVLVNVALDNDVDIEAACGGELACSTCHCILSKALFDQVPSKLEEEDDMLDLAIGLTDTSRLSCQLKVTEAFRDAEIIIPEE
jgi:ferredoxin